MKTNPMRILDKAKIAYTPYEYDTEGGIDGISVAAKLGKTPSMVFKTLITQGKSNYYCFIVPVDKELNLNLAALAAKEKSIVMIKQNLLKEVTGYIKGGCSPIGMKKKLPTFIDISCSEFDTIIVSGGKIGVQIEIRTEDLIKETCAFTLNLS